MQTLPLNTSELITLRECLRREHVLCLKQAVHATCALKAKQWRHRAETIHLLLQKVEACLQ